MDARQRAAVTIERRPGDGGRFASVHARFARAVHGIALAHVGAEEADDVTQEAFVSIHRGLDAVRDDDAIAAWVCTVARNTAIDHLRRTGRRPTLVALPAEPEARPQDEGELAGRVLALVRSLPEAYRETLVLRLVEGLTGPEIAARTGLTHGSVRVNLTRGMAMLRPMLRKEGYP